MQMPLVVPESRWKATPIADLPSWAEASRVAVDVETRDEQLVELGPGVRRGGYLVGVSFAIEDGSAHYLPFAHREAEDDLDRDLVLRYLGDQLKTYDGTIVGANLSYDLDYILEAGIVFHPDVMFRDVQVAEPLLDEFRQSYSLDALAALYELPGKDERLLREAAHAYGIEARYLKRDMWRLPARYVGPYAEQDARLPLRILRRQERKIGELGLNEVYDLESALTPVLTDMTRRGVRIDMDHLDAVERWTREEEVAAIAVVARETGYRLAESEAANNAIVGPMLEKHYGKRVPRTKTGKYSVTNDRLERLGDELCMSLSRARQMSKVRTTFVTSIRDHATHGRLHTTYHQLRHDRHDRGRDAFSSDVRGTTSGRLSASDPNIQQQPSRHDEIAPMWRRIFLPEDGCVFRRRDYSQQEPRLMVHYAELYHVKGRAEPGLRGAREFGDRYRNDPETDFHGTTSELSGLVRKKAKNVGLGYVYGMSDARMSVECGFGFTVHKSRKGKAYRAPDAEGQAAIDKFNAGVPFLAELRKAVRDRVEERGYLTTLFGRRRNFRQKEDGSYDWLHKALNVLIQGGAAYQMKKGMLDAYHAGAPLQLQVHDELDDSVEDPEAPDVVSEAMRDAVELTVPTVVSVEDGPSWGEVA